MIKKLSVVGGVLLVLAATGCGKEKVPPPTPHTTLTVLLDKDTRAESVSLILWDVEQVSGMRGFRVFVGGTESGYRGLREDPHYLDTFVFGYGDTESFATDLGPTLRRLRSLGRCEGNTVSLTVVPYPDPTVGRVKVRGASIKSEEK